MTSPPAVSLPFFSHLERLSKRRRLLEETSDRALGMVVLFWFLMARRGLVALTDLPPLYPPRMLGGGETYPPPLISPSHLSSLSHRHK